MEIDLCSLMLEVHQNKAGFYTGLSERAIRWGVVTLDITECTPAGVVGKYRVLCTNSRKKKEKKYCTLLATTYAEKEQRRLDFELEIQVSGGRIVANHSAKAATCRPACLRRSIHSFELKECVRGVGRGPVGVCVYVCARVYVCRPDCARERGERLWIRG